MLRFAVRLFALTTFGTLASLFYLNDLSRLPQNTLDFKEAVAVHSSSKWCQGDECTTGSWQPRQPPFTSLRDVKIAFLGHDSDWFWTCDPPPDSLGIPLTDDEKRVAGEKRQVQVSNWAWVPSIGKMMDWNAEEFVIRMLRSPGGLILIGDSLTRQHYDTVETAISSANIATDVDLPTLPLSQHKNVHQRTLKKDNAITYRLLERAGVPLSRLERPIMTMLEDHMLIGEHDIRDITGVPAEYNWYHDFQSVEDWEAFVASASMPRPGEESSVTEDTVVLLNNGAHWTRHELSMLPSKPTIKEEQRLVSEANRQMVSRVLSRLSPIPQLSIYYRATSPGHPMCQRHSKPYANETLAWTAEQNIVERLLNTPGVNTADDRNGISRWDWDLFSVHNENWKSTIQQMMANGQLGRKGAKAFYLDVWNQTLQRPDAHSMTTLPVGVDCLHWCLPLITTQWTYQLNHLVLLESEMKTS